MSSIILDRPYQFVSPVRDDRWPAWIQRLRLIDWYLRRHDGVLDYELRDSQRLSESVAAGDSIILAPNHCRYADPIVMGWLSRHVGVPMHALASWHLFNTNAFEQFALRRMGAYSILREANDRRSLETSIDLIAGGKRPLIIFPEGTTNRTNDRLKPLLEGVTFIARTAAKRRAKRDGGRVVIHPVGLKYQCVGDPRPWIRRQLATLTERLTWSSHIPTDDGGLVEQTQRLCDGFLALKEIEYLGEVGQGSLRRRRNRLTEAIFANLERRYGLATSDQASPWARIRSIRAAIYAASFADTAAPDPRRFHRDAHSIELAQFLVAFPDDYLAPGQATDMRLVETIERLQEGLNFKPDAPVTLSVIVEVDEAIAVPADRAPRGQVDPLLVRLEQRLSKMLDRLCGEANRLDLMPPRATVSEPSDVPAPAPIPAASI